MRKPSSIIRKPKNDENGKVKFGTLTFAGNGTYVYTVTEDMGKVIGRQGRIAKAIRAVVKAASAKTDKKVIVDITQ